jgi:pimeloyl-ACP methyl ester carboxylesterase
LLLWWNSLFRLTILIFLAQQSTIIVSKFLEKAVMPFERPTTDPTDLYYRDRLLATTPFNPVEFAKTFEHRRARIQNVNFHYTIGGPGPVIIFGHGWPASWYEWRKVMPQLIDRFTCVAFDLPGLGDSTPPAYTPDGKVLPENSLTMPLKYIGAELGFGGHLGGDRQRAFKTIDRYATNASYETVDRCSHWVSEDRPVYIAEKIAEFFS